ncbi:hypothetical protein EDD86DRAFT_249453 [Gorgonomyces haynaldii]|nr:hypothetical protein EDD86DRAFT_249453 [Gorgonomyces haynaldii]
MIGQPVDLTNQQFPGAEPNRLTKHHLHHLLERDYLLCDNTISFIPDVHFPTNQQQFHNDTLLDGEFRIVYCSFDLLAINGTSMILQQDVILPYSKLKDTLISFEWRAPNHNTFRFRIHVVRDKDLKLHYQIMVADKSINKYYDSLSLEPEIAQADKPVQGEQRKLLASIRSYQEPLTELIERMRHEWKQREKRGLDTRRKSSEIRHIRRDSQDMDSTRSDSTSHPSPHVNISPHVQSNAKPDLGYVSPKRQKTEPEEEEEELDNGSSVPIQPMTIENIAEHQPKKLEQNVEIALPPPLTVQTSDKNLDDEDSPLEDLSLERYKRSVVVKTVQSVTPSVTPPVHLPPQPSPSLQSPTLSSSQNPSLQSPTHPSATQRSPNLQSPGQATGTNPPVMQTPEQKKKKKREWLDMILNS